MVRTGTISLACMRKKKDTDQDDLLGLYLGTASEKDLFNRQVTQKSTGLEREAVRDPGDTPHLVEQKILGTFVEP